MNTPTHSGSFRECVRPDSPRVSYAVAIVIEMEVQPKDINCQLTLCHEKMSTAAGAAAQGKHVPRGGVNVENVAPLKAKIGQSPANGLSGTSKFGE